VNKPVLAMFCTLKAYVCAKWSVKKGGVRVQERGKGERESERERERKKRESREHQQQ